MTRIHGVHGAIVWWREWGQCHGFLGLAAICANPYCGCTDIEFFCLPDPPVDRAGDSRRNPMVFGLDVARRRITDTTPGQGHPLSQQLALAVVQELTTEDLDMLSRICSSS